MNHSTRSKIVGVFSVALMTLTLITLGVGPGLAAPAPQGMQSIPGIEVVVRYDDRYNPYHVPPPEQTELGIQSASFAVNWNPTGIGRCSGTLSPWPQEAKDAFNYAVGIWASLLNSSQTIEVDACWRSDLGPGILGSCGPTNFYANFPNAPLTNTWYPVALANALANTDLYPGNPEIRSSLSSTFSWYFGTDGNTPPTQLDFVSVVLHELGHGVGFVGSMLVDNGSGSAECNGVNGYGCWGISGYPFIYDRFVEDGNSTSLLATGPYPNPSSALGSALTGNVGGGVYFDGPNANAANGGARVKLYTPGTWISGSSYSHLDEIFNNTPNALMTWSFSLGESVHSPGPVMLGMFQDMNWSITSGEGGCTPIWSDDHEDGFTDWTVTNGTGTNSWQGRTNGGYSGSNYWFVADIAGPTDSYLASQTISATANNHSLRFFHKYNLEYGYDGGVVEININNGGWTDVGSANFTENGYDTTISTGFSSPIAGRQAFSGNSSGYIESVVDLSNLVSGGDNFRIRFREANDTSVGYDGWYVDDVQVCGQGQTKAYLPIVVKNH